MRRYCAVILAIAVPLVGAVASRTLGQATHLVCERHEWQYAECQVHRTRFYGVWSEAEPSRRIRGADVEEFVYRDSEGNRRTAYDLYLLQGEERILFHRYHAIDRAYADVRQIHDLMSGFGAESLRIDRRNLGKDFTLVAIATATLLQALWVGNQWVQMPRRFSQSPRR